jgi:hypothetical protein
MPRYIIRRSPVSKENRIKVRSLLLPILLSFNHFKKTISQRLMSSLNHAVCYRVINRDLNIINPVKIQDINHFPYIFRVSVYYQLLK